MFSLDLNQFTDSGSRGGKETNYEVPKHFIILFQTFIPSFWLKIIVSIGRTIAPMAVTKRPKHKT